MLKLSIAFLLFFVSNFTSAQLKGSYVYSVGVDEGSRTLTFNGNNFTIKQTGQKNNINGGGSYKMIGDDLYFYYHHMEYKDSSVYKIETKPSYSKYTKISVRAFEDKTEINGSMVALRDYDFNIILYTTTKTMGQANLSISKIEDVKYLTVDFIGYNRVTIPYSKIVGNENDIFVDFKPNNTAIKPARVDIFRIINREENSFTLRNSSGEVFLFKKSK